MQFMAVLLCILQAWGQVAPYDAAGNVASTIRSVSGTTPPITQQTDFVYDARNRKVQSLAPAVLDADPASATFNTLVRPSMVWEYDPAGRSTAAFDARGHETDSVYDAGNRVVKVYQPAVQVNGQWMQPVTESSYESELHTPTIAVG
jgi:hypothetical protein